MKKYKILDLFSGLGGFSLGLERTGCFETVAFCDNNKFSKLILDKHWKGTKIYDDIREITKEKFKTDGIESPDIITGGFPCQPFSVAGKQKGTSDDRHLWPEMFRIIKAFKPRFVIGENVRGIINIQDGVVFETVCTDLESEGYEVQPFIIPASGVGAPHRRERVWIIAIREESMVNSDNIRFKQYSTTKEESSGRRSSATFESTSTKNVGNSQYNGSFTDKIGRGNEEINGGTEKRQNSSFEFERTSRSKDNGNVSKTENVADTENGRGQQTQSERWQGTERGSINSRGIEGERKDIGSNVAYTNESGSRERKISRDIDNEGRRTGETGGESLQSKDRQTRTGNLGSGSTNVADTNSGLCGRGRTIESSREDSEGRIHSKEEEQTRKHFRSETIGRSSIRGETKNVADTEIIGTREFRHSDQTQGREGSRSTQLNGSSSEMANTDSERLEGFRQSSRQFNEKSFTPSSGEERQGNLDQGWWSVEPNVGRVAYGVSGRVHRLKGLGNSIVPQIAEEIGYAIIKAVKD